MLDGNISKIDFSYEDKDKISLKQDLELDEELNENVLLNLNTAFLSIILKLQLKRVINFKNH